MPVSQRHIPENAEMLLTALFRASAGCFVRGALPGENVQCLGYESWRWTIWGGIAYFIERIIREVSNFHHSVN